MKTSKIILGLFILFVLSVSITSAQQTFTQTVIGGSNGNINCNATCSVIDIPALNNNPAAVLFITQTGGTSNPHPIGAYYMYLGRWSVFNLDAVAISVGAQFKVEYFAPDANHFVYSILPRIHTSDPAYIDNVGLNNNPNAQIRVFPHCSATIGNTWNQLDVKVEYDKTADKWFIANLNGTPVTPAVAYNVMFSQGYSATNPNVNKEINTTPKTPISNSPIKNGSITPKRISSGATNENAGGDLNGTYPNPTVIGLQGKPLSNVAPTVGQILKWNGSDWIPTEPLKTFFKDGIPNPIDIPNNTLKIFSDLSQTIVLTTKSRLVISGMITIMGADYGPQCASYDCKPSNGFFEIQINGNRKFTLAVATPGHSRTSSTISNYMIDLNPGTYNVEFGIRNTAYVNSQSMSAHPLQSSIMVIPLE